MIDKLKLRECCSLAKVVDTWTVGALVSYACERVTSDEVWNWTCDDLRNYVYDRYVDELMGMSDSALADVRRISGGSGNGGPSGAAPLAAE